MARIGRGLGLAVVLAWLAGGVAAEPAGAERGKVEAGRYLALAGDCAACHGMDFAGGDPIASPMGDIYASNITPDEGTGIGTWSLAQFSDLMRKGKAPDGHIFPAMPYMSYTGLDDDQIASLYSYLMLGVRPVPREAPETDLPFPFVRPAMIGWNALFLDEGRSAGAIDVTGPVLERGRVLVESLEHCSACHSPRGQLMQPLAGKHLSGAMLAGWWAPNITSDPSGIGGWSDERLTTYLRKGHVEDAVAAGEMSKVVSISLGKLEKDDITAIVAYLRAVPAIPSSRPGGIRTDQPAVPIDVAALETPEGRGWEARVGHDTLDGLALYQGACASCHGMDGNGSKSGAHPSLHRVGSVTGPQAATLVQVVAHGVNRDADGLHALMPGFRSAMSDPQIASVASYVRTTFGGVAEPVDAGQVSRILSGRIDVPWLIRNARWLSIAGLVGLILVVILIAGGIGLRNRQRRGRVA